MMLPPLSERKQAFINILERTAGNVYTDIKCKTLNLCSISPPVQLYMGNYIQANQQKWFNYLEGKIAEMADLCFVSEETTLEEALAAADGYVDALVTDYLEKQFDIPRGAVNICANLLFGKNIT